ncbi:MAG: hypothetical protein U0641_20230 [Anaerolineae bacterium]
MPAAWSSAASVEQSADEARRLAERALDCDGDGQRDGSSAPSRTARG